MNQTISIALAGNPNSGKTTLFNELTGSSQHVGNWPGVTVEQKTGKLRRNKDVSIIDLPGIYSLSPYTPEEIIARDYLLDEKPNLIINIVDASNLERNLYLTTQLIDTGIPVVMALNMMDIVNKSGDKIDINEISKRLGCPVVPISAAKSKGISDLVTVALDCVNNTTGKDPAQRFIDEAYGKLDSEEEEEAIDLRYANVQAIVDGTYNKVRKASSITTSDKIDKVVTNKWLAIPIFFMIMYFIYYVSIVSVGDLTIGWVESLFEWIGGGVTTLLTAVGASDMIMSLVIDGIIGGIGAIFTFVPQLMILFFFLSLLEDSGYMARVAFIMDRIFRKFGLSGKSFVPMLIGTGCSIPGIMASRTIENEKDRKMTVILTPFIPCGAKLPVFAMFIAMMFRNQTWVGPSMYLIGIAMVIVSGIILKKTKLFAGDPAPFVMELPTYKFPSLKGVAIHMWEKAKSFIKKAGTIIFAACVVLWFLQNFSFTGYVGPDAIDQSILASIGNSIKFIFVPLGFGDNWAAPVASITGLIAKEIVVATFATVGASVPIMFSQVTAFAFMIFTLFAAPCAAAIGATKRELGSWKLTGFAVLYQTGLAYVLAMLVNLVGNALFSGTQAVQKIALDIGLMEAASEGDVTSFNPVMAIFIAIVAVAIVVGVITSIKAKFTDPTKVSA